MFCLRPFVMPILGVMEQRAHSIVLPSALLKGRYYMTQEQDLLTGNVPKKLIQFAFPLFLANLLQALYNVVDSVFVAMLSQDAMNAVSLAFPLQNLMIAFGAGTAVGINALLSRSLGEKNQAMADRAANTGIFLALCNFALFALIGIFFSRTFFELQAGGEQVIIDYGVDYASICLGCSIGIFSQFCFERLLQSTGRTFLAMCTQLTGALINIVLDPILIFGWFGLPRMEVAGAAIATVAGQIVAAAAALVLNLKCNPDIHILPREIRWHGKVAAEIYRVGFPSIVMQSIGSAMVFGMNKILFSFTKTATAVFGAYFKLQSFVFMPVFGLNNGMVPIIAYNYGAQKPERIHKTIRLGMVYAVAIMMVGLLVFQLIPKELLLMFDASDAMLEIGAPALRIMSLAFVFAGIGIVSGSSCQAFGYSVYSMLISIARQIVVLIPAAYLLSLTGVLRSIWFAFPIAEIFSLILSLFFLRTTLKKTGMALPKAK